MKKILLLVFLPSFSFSMLRDFELGRTQVTCMHHDKAKKEMCLRIYNLIEAIQEGANKSIECLVFAAVGLCVTGNVLEKPILVIGGCSTCLTASCCAICYDCCDCFKKSIDHRYLHGD